MNIVQNGTTHISLHWLKHWWNRKEHFASLVPANKLSSRFADLQTCALHIVHWTLHIAHWTLHIAHWTLRIAYCILHVANCTLHIADLCNSDKNRTAAKKQFHNFLRSNFETFECGFILPLVVNNIIFQLFGQTFLFTQGRNSCNILCN